MKKKPTKNRKAFFFIAIIVTGCSSQPKKTFEEPKEFKPTGFNWGVGYKSKEEENRHAVWVVCDICPDATKKTPYKRKYTKTSVTPKTKKVTEKSSPKVFSIGEEILSVNFEYKKYNLNQEAKTAIDLIADHLKGLKVSVSAYTDNIASKKYNKKLSELRAQAVKDYLVTKHGFDTADIDAKGFGKCCFIANNTTDKGRHTNRRAVIVRSK